MRVPFSISTKDDSSAGLECLEKDTTIREGGFLSVVLTLRMENGYSEKEAA